MSFVHYLSREVHLGTLRPFIEMRQAAGVKHKSINLALSIVRRILNLSARLWRDEAGITWLETAPLIQMLPTTDARKPYPLSWDEQATLMQALPDHLARMSLFKVNTGCREQDQRAVEVLVSRSADDAELLQTRSNLGASFAILVRQSQPQRAVRKAKLEVVNDIRMMKAAFLQICQRLRALLQRRVVVVDDLV